MNTTLGDEPTTTTATKPRISLRFFLAVPIFTSILLLFVSGWFFLATKTIEPLSFAEPDMVNWHAKAMASNNSATISEHAEEVWQSSESAKGLAISFHRVAASGFAAILWIAIVNLILCLAGFIEARGR